MGLRSIPAWQVPLSIVLFLNFFQNILPAQRIFLPPTGNPQQGDISLPSATSPSLSTPPDTQILKVYPDGTKKIVPLEALNYRDDGAAYGGPPRLSLYQPGPSPGLSRASPERLAIAPIGISGEAVSVPASVPPSPVPILPAAQFQTAAPDPMGGGSVANPLGGGGSVPQDPLAGSPASAPPLQTISGKPAPLVGSAASVQLGSWDSFFMNAAVGAALQGQLNASAVYNGTARQSYPYTYPLNAISTNAVVNGESFTFQPGFRFDLEFGYQFNDCLGIFLETGILYNGLDTYQINLANTVPVPTEGGVAVFPPGLYTFNATGDLTQVPVQLNVILRWPGETAFKPFVSGGIGTVWQQLDVNTFNAGPLEVQGGYTRSAFQFGWNAQLGLTYTVDTALDFYAAFKMLSSIQPVIGSYQFATGYNLGVVVGIQSRF